LAPVAAALYKQRASPDDERSMSQPHFDFEEARRRMVDSQVRPNKVNDPRILNAMRNLPRERFLPPALASMAYIDEDVPLGGGRVLMEPMVIARLVQIVRPRQGEKALVVGAGTGYGSAVLAACGVQVTALEEDQALLAIARGALAEFAPGVLLASGPLAEGWAQGAPWDLIFVEGAAPEIPPAIAAQVRREGGRLAGVLVTPSGVMQAVLAEPSLSGLRSRPEFDCTTGILPGLQPAAAFAF
jgi:protein-L-isoaspartate(D-aspartate) O-methyltransferase